MDNREAVELYSGMVARLCAAKLSGRGRADTEDTVQEVFLRYASARPAFRDEAQGRAWFIRCAVNCCNDYYRRSGRRRANETALDDNMAAYGSAEPYDAALDDMMSCLPQGMREVVYLHYVEDMPTDAVAKALGMTGAGVRMRLSRARSLLRRFLESEEGGECNAIGE